MYHFHLYLSSFITQQKSTAAHDHLYSNRSKGRKCGHPTNIQEFIVKPILNFAVFTFLIYALHAIKTGEGLAMLAFRVMKAIGKCCSGLDPGRGGDVGNASPPLAIFNNALDE